MTVLMIVESPNKAKKIRGYFKDFNVIATVGHFKDLPNNAMGVEPPEHKPQWDVLKGKEEVVKRLRAAADKADIIYVATDPDREGEAIGGHVVNTLGSKHRSKISRITYKEISKKAITEAINKKHTVNWYLVKAQEARRVLDRYVGYMVSPVLTEKLKPHGLQEFITAGRLQSIAARLLVERKDTIDAFVSEKHFGVTAKVEHHGIEFKAVWQHGLAKGDLFKDENIAQNVAENTSQLTAIDIETTETQVAPPKPLITTTFCALMANELKLTTKQAMEVAQKLYEAGLITYHRTDSPEVSEDFIKTVWGFAASNQLPLPQTPRIFKAGKNAQEGHECLRVVDINLFSARAAGIDDDIQQKAYQLVWRRSLECMLANGINDLRIITFLNEQGDTFLTKASVDAFPGWRGAADRFVKISETSHKSEQDEQEVQLPGIKENETLKPVIAELETKHTKPPAAYTEKTLVAQLEKMGIGRPSSYASTLERLVTVQYVSRETNQHKLIPTDLGIAVVNTLINNFSFMQYDYTAVMEECLDSIANAESKYLDIVSVAYNSLEDELAAFKSESAPETAIASLKKALKTLPAGNNTKSKKKSKAKPKVSSITPASAGHSCPSCKNGKLTVQKFNQGNNAGKSFMGCSNFPTCKHFSWLQ